MAERRAPVELNLSDIVEKANNSDKLTGLSVNYYGAMVRTHDGEMVTIECEDLVDALELTPDEFCVLKSLWRRARMRQGSGKPGGKALYDAEKIFYSARRILDKDKRAANADHE